MVHFFVVFSITHFRFNRKIFTQILNLCINNTAPRFYQLSNLNVLTNFWFSNFLLACDATGRLLVEGGPLVIGFKETHSNSNGCTNATSGDTRIYVY